MSILENYTDKEISLSLMSLVPLSGRVSTKEWLDAVDVIERILNILNENKIDLNHYLELFNPRESFEKLFKEKDSLSFINNFKFTLGEFVRGPAVLMFDEKTQGDIMCIFNDIEKYIAYFCFIGAVCVDELPEGFIGDEEVDKLRQMKREGSLSEVDFVGTYVFNGVDQCKRISTALQKLGVVV